MNNNLAVTTDASGQLTTAEGIQPFSVNSDVITLGVDGADALTVNAAADFTDDLNVDGSTTTTGITNTGAISTTTTLDVGTDATVGGTLDVTGATTVGDLTSTGPVTLGDDDADVISIQGATTVTGNSTSLSAAQTNLNSADINIGDAASDYISLNGTIDTDLTLDDGTALADGFETRVTVVTPTADNTISLPDKSGTVVLSGGGTLNNNLAVTTDGSGQLTTAEGVQPFSVNSDVITLGVDGADALTVNAAADFTDDLNVDGSTTTTGITNTGAISTTTTLGVGTDATVGGTLDVTGATTVGDLTSTGPVTLGDDDADVISIQGATTVTGNSTSLSAAQTNLNSADINIGDAASDYISLNGTIDTDLTLDDGTALADGFETRVTVVTPTADNTISLPDKSGTVVLSGGGTLNNNLAVTTDGSGQLTTAEGVYSLLA